MCPPPRTRFESTATCRTQMHLARRDVVTPEMRRVAEREHLPAELIRAEVARGRMIIPANVHHAALEPMAIGMKARVQDQREHRQLADDVLARGGARQAAPRRALGRRHRHGPLDRRRHRRQPRRDPRGLARADRHRADLPGARTGCSTRKSSRPTAAPDARAPGQQGVDYFTIHAGVLLEYLPLVKHRITGIVSRGGSIMAQWMIENHKQNPFYTHCDKVLEICAKYDVSISPATACAPAASPTRATRRSSPS